MVHGEHRRAGQVPGNGRGRQPRNRKVRQGPFLRPVRQCESHALPNRQRRGWNDVFHPPLFFSAQAFNKAECMRLLDLGRADVTSLDPGDVFVGGRYHSLLPIMKVRCPLRSSLDTLAALIHCRVQVQVDSNPTVLPCSISHLLEKIIQIGPGSPDYYLLESQIRSLYSPVSACGLVSSNFNR